MLLDISPLQKALETLHTGLNRASLEPGDLEVRDACIQRFEYSYELCVKFIKRYIEAAYPIPENIDQMNFKDFLRLAAEIGLVQDVQAWFRFRDARNKTSHAYDAEKAAYVFSHIPHFMEESEFLLHQLALKLASL